jgi:uncharacterized protein YxeA
MELNHKYISNWVKSQTFDFSCFSFERIILFSYAKIFFRRFDGMNQEREEIIMKKKLTGALFLALLVALMSFAAVPAAAATFRYVPTDKSYTKKERTVGGALFLTKNYRTDDCDLYVTKNGVRKKISKKATGGGVISNGVTVYYSARVSKRSYLYRYTISSGTKKMIGRLCKGSSRDTLCGYYDKEVYYTIDSPDGSFARIDLNDGEVEGLASGYPVTSAVQNGKYFFLHDGTGEGYSYLGIFYADKGKFKKIATKPCKWYYTANAVYFAELSDGVLPSTEDDPALIAVKSFTFSDAKRTTLINSVEVLDVKSITSKYIKYTDVNGKNVTRYW